MKQSLGQNHSSTFSAIWNGINDISATIEELSVEDIKDAIHSNGLSISTLESSTEVFVKYWKALSSNWLPRVNTIENELVHLKSKFDKHVMKRGPYQSSQNLNSILFQSSSLNHPPVCLSQDPNQKLFKDASDIMNLEATVKLLQSKIQSMEDLQEDFKSKLHENSDPNQFISPDGNLGHN